MRGLKVIPYLFLIGGVVLWALPALAGGPVKARQGAQIQRISRGILEGTVSSGEQLRLLAEQRAIGRAKARALCDGWVDGRERKRLGGMLDRASRNIYRATHNDRGRYPTGDGARRRIVVGPKAKRPVCVPGFPPKTHGGTCAVSARWSLPGVTLSFATHGG